MHTRPQARTFMSTPKFRKIEHSGLAPPSATK